MYYSVQKRGDKRHRVHRVAATTLKRTFHHDEQVSPGYKVVVYAQAERAHTLPLFLFYPYMYSGTRDPLVNTRTFLERLLDERNLESIFLREIRL